MKDERLRDSQKRDRNGTIHMPWQAATDGFDRVTRVQGSKSLGIAQRGSTARIAAVEDAYHVLHMPFRLVLPPTCIIRAQEGSNLLPVLLSKDQKKKPYVRAFLF